MKKDTTVCSSVHSHPLEPVDRLLLDEADALQDAGDVIDPPLAGLQARGHLPDVQRAVRRRQHQLQELLRQLGHGGIWTKKCSNLTIYLTAVLYKLVTLY